MLSDDGFECGVLCVVSLLCVMFCAWCVVVCGGVGCCVVCDVL